MRPAVPCPRCGARNRVDAERARRGSPPVCGRCRTTLPLAADLVEVTDSRFEEQVLTSSLPVLLEVWAPWCVPCRGMEPVIEELATTLSGRVRVGRLNFDRSPQSTARLRIQGVPTVILFKDGHEVTRLIGARGRAELVRALAGVA